MLQKGSFCGLEYLYYNNNVYANENENSYCFDVSNCTNTIRKLILDKRIRLTINSWDINFPRTL